MDSEKLWNVIADVFNKTALGVGIIIAGYHLVEANYIRAFILLFVFVPLYFYLYNRFGPEPISFSSLINKNS